MNSSALEPLPSITIEDEAADADEEVPVKTWEEKIRNMLIKGIDGKIVLEDLLKFYSRSLQQQMDVSEDKSLLKDKILSHLNYFHIHYMEMNDIFHLSNYYELMEDVLAYYCTIELELLKKRKPGKKETRTNARSVAQRILMVLTTFLGQREVHMIHVLLKMKYNNMSNNHIEVRKFLYNKMLFQGTICNTTEEAFCRCYILFLFYKDLIHKDLHDNANRLFYARYGWQHDIKSSPMLSSILMVNLEVDNTQMINTVGSLVDLKNNIKRRYFAYLKEKKTQVLECVQPIESSTCDNSEEESLKEILFGNALNVSEEDDSEHCVVILSDDEEGVTSYERPSSSKRIRKQRKDIKNSKLITVIDIDDCEETENNSVVIDLTEPTCSGEMAKPVDEVTTNKPTSSHSAVNQNVNDNSIESSNRNKGVDNELVMECTETSVNTPRQSERAPDKSSIRLNGGLASVSTLVKTGADTEKGVKTASFQENDGNTSWVESSKINPTRGLPDEPLTSSGLVVSQGTEPILRKSSELTIPTASNDLGIPVNSSPKVVSETVIKACPKELIKSYESMAVSDALLPSVSSNLDAGVSEEKPQFSEEPVASLESTKSPSTEDIVEISDSVEPENFSEIGCHEKSETVSDTTETMLISDSTETVLVLDSTETIMVEDTTETMIVSDTTETMIVSDATETMIALDSTETMIASDSTKTMRASDTTETMTASDSTETMIVSDGTETIISDCTEVMALEGTETENCSTTDGLLISPETVPTSEDIKGADTLDVNNVDSKNSLEPMVVSENTDHLNLNVESDGSGTLLKLSEAKQLPVTKHNSPLDEHPSRVEQANPPENGKKKHDLNELMDMYTDMLRQKDTTEENGFKTLKELFFAFVNVHRNGNSTANTKAEIDRMFDTFVNEDAGNETGVDEGDSPELPGIKDDPPLTFEQTFSEFQDPALGMDNIYVENVGSEVIIENPEEVFTFVEEDHSSMVETYKSTEDIVKSEPTVEFSENLNQFPENEEFVGTSDEEFRETEEQQLIKLDDYTNNASVASSSSYRLQPELMTSCMMTPDSDQNTDENYLQNNLPLRHANLLIENDSTCNLEQENGASDDLKSQDSETDVEFDIETDAAQGDFPVMRDDTTVVNNILLTPNASEGKAESIPDEMMYICPLNSEISEHSELTNTHSETDDFVEVSHADSEVESPKHVYETVCNNLHPNDLNFSKLSIQSTHEMSPKDLKQPTRSMGVDLKSTEKVKGLFSLIKRNNSKKLDDYVMTTGTHNDVFEHELSGHQTNYPKPPVSVLQNVCIISPEAKKAAASKRMFSSIDRVIASISVNDHTSNVPSVGGNEKPKTGSPKKIVYTSKETIKQASLSNEFEAFGEYQDSFSGRLTKINGESHHCDNYNLFECEKKGGSSVKPVWETAKSHCSSVLMTSGSPSPVRFPHASVASVLQAPCTSGMQVKEVRAPSIDSRSSSPISSPPYEDISDFKSELPIMTVVQAPQEPVRKGILKNKDEKVRSMLDVRTPYEMLKKRKLKMKEEVPKKVKIMSVAMVNDVPKRVKILEHGDGSKESVVYYDVYDEKLETEPIVYFGKKYSELELIERYHKTYIDSNLVNHHTQHRCIHYRIDREEGEEESSQPNPTRVPDPMKFLEENPVTGNNGSLPSNSSRRQGKTNNVGRGFQRGKRKRGRPPKTVGQRMPSLSVRKT